jgi:hypothetical protein
MEVGRAFIGFKNDPFRSGRAMIARVVYCSDKEGRYDFVDDFCAGGAAALVAGRAGAKSEFNLVESRIAKKDFKGLTKEDLGTPALILTRCCFRRTREDGGAQQVDRHQVACPRQDSQVRRHQ